MRLASREQRQGSPPLPRAWNALDNHTLLPPGLVPFHGANDPPLISWCLFNEARQRHFPPPPPLPASLMSLLLVFSLQPDCKMHESHEKPLCWLSFLLGICTSGKLELKQKQNCGGFLSTDVAQRGCFSLLGIRISPREGLRGPVHTSCAASRDQQLPWHVFHKPFPFPTGLPFVGRPT